MRTIALVVGLLLLFGCSKLQPQPAKSDLTPQEQAMVGEWLAQMVVTQKMIDDYHAAYPEGNKDAVAKYHEEWASRPLYVLRFNDNRTVTYLTAWGNRAGPRDEDTKWRISEDGKTLVLTQTSEYSSRTINIVDGKEVVEDTSGTHTQDMEYEIAADGKSFSDLPLREQRFLRKDSFEAKAAFSEPEPVNPIDFAINVTRDDFIGTWKLDLSSIGDPLALRAGMGQSEIDEITERIASIDVRLEIKAAGTWEVKGEAERKGTWKFDKSRNAAVLSFPLADMSESEFRLSKDKGYAYMFEVSFERTPGGKFKRMD